MENVEFLQALNAYEQSVLIPQAGAAAGAQAVNFCGVYKVVGPILKGILPFVALLPGFGAAAAAALTELTTVLDAVCHSQSSQSALGVAGHGEFLQAVQAFSSSSQGSAPATSAQAVDVCGTWKKVGPILKGLIPAVKKIPIIGARAAAALQAIADALDALCPQTANAVTKG